MPPRKKPRWLEYMDVDELLDAPTNAKGHADEQIDESIERFGFIETIVLDERTGKLIAGHGRRNQLRKARASKSDVIVPDGIVVAAGKWYAPVTRGWASKDDAEAEAAAIALNRVGEVGGWNDKVLAESLQRLNTITNGMKGIGFDTEQLKLLQSRLNVPEFKPTGDEAQPRLDVRNPIECPKCGHKFHRV